MRLTLVFLLAVLEMSIFGGCERKEKSGNPGSLKAMSGDPKLEGTYVFVGEEVGGTLIKETEKDRIYTISGNKMIPPKGKKEQGTTINCDPSKNPSEIDLSRTETSGKVDTWFGIYKLEDDVLTLCILKTDNPADRPREFKTKDTKAAIWMLKKTH